MSFNRLFVPDFSGGRPHCDKFFSRTGVNSYNGVQKLLLHSHFHSHSKSLHTMNNFWKLYHSLDNFEKPSRLFRACIFSETFQAKKYKILIMLTWFDLRPCSRCRPKMQMSCKCLGQISKAVTFRSSTQVVRSQGILTMSQNNIWR